MQQFTRLRQLGFFTYFISRKWFGRWRQVGPVRRSSSESLCRIASAADLDVDADKRVMDLRKGSSLIVHLMLRIADDADAQRASWKETIPVLLRNRRSVQMTVLHSHFLTGGLSLSRRIGVSGPDKMHLEITLLFILIYAM